jgi:hypothetical protein
MTWDAVHRRGQVLRAVVREADARRDGLLPRDVPGVAETFADVLALVAALQLRWHTRLAGAIERELMARPAEPRAAVLDAWREAAADLVGVRLVLDACTAAPTSEPMHRALQIAQRKDWALMAAMAGLANGQDQWAARVGRRLEDEARALHVAA